MEDMCARNACSWRALMPPEDLCLRWLSAGTPPSVYVCMYVFACARLYVCAEEGVFVCVCLCVYACSWRALISANGTCIQWLSAGTALLCLYACMCLRMCARSWHAFICVWFLSSLGALASAYVCLYSRVYVSALGTL
jgi:hypothetical protein